MATFKVGQRVRVANPHPAREAMRGLEGVVNRIGVHGYAWAATIHGADAAMARAGHIFLSSSSTDSWAFYEGELAPLTDPKADAFIEQIKRLKPEPESVPLPARVKA